MQGTAKEEGITKEKKTSLDTEQIYGSMPRVTVLAGCRQLSYCSALLCLRESLETAVRRVGSWCEMAASLGISCSNE
jgi:hypothetical protein